MSSHLHLRYTSRAGTPAGVGRTAGRRKEGPLTRDFLFSDEHSTHRNTPESRTRRCVLPPPARHSIHPPSRWTAPDRKGPKVAPFQGCTENNKIVLYDFTQVDRRRRHRGRKKTNNTNTPSLHLKKPPLKRLKDRNNCAYFVPVAKASNLFAPLSRDMRETKKKCGFDAGTSICSTLTPEVVPFQVKRMSDSGLVLLRSGRCP